MADLQMLDLGRVMTQAGNINAQRRENRLADLMVPYLEREMPRKEQEAVAQGQDADLRRKALYSKLAIGIMGDDFESLADDQKQARFGEAMQALGEIGAPKEWRPEKFEPGLYTRLKSLANVYGSTQNDVLSTYTDDKGNRVAVMRNGPPQIIGKSYVGPVYDKETNAYFDPVTRQTFMADGGRASSGGGQPPADVFDQAQREKSQRDADAAAAKARAEASARADVERGTKESDRMVGSQQTLNDLARMRELASQGVYTGGVLDRAGNFLASAGAPVDQGRANRTAQIMQLATQMKFGVKPPGMGAMSDSEWKIIQDAIPDPRAAGNDKQLLAGIEEAQRRIEQWRSSQGASPRSAPAIDAETDAMLRRLGL